MDVSQIIEDTSAKLEALRLRLPELEGKANKRERTQVNKEIYALENDESYVAAMKSLTEANRAEAAAADDEAHRDKLKQEAEEEAARAAAAEEAAAAKRAAGGAAAKDDDGEVHMQVKLLKKGDEETFAQDGDKVALTYTGSFAEGVTHEGADYSGKQFDSTLQSAGKNKKAHKPLAFKLGEGKAIRGWEECVRKMSLGEKVEVTIDPKWAYRKGGLQDDNGKYIVPPNATLFFEMRLVQVREKTVDPN